jgi:arylsulfatase A-like enzyme
MLTIAGVVPAAERPNVVFLLSDDQRFDTVHALGNPEIRTPNLDRLVRDGFTFTHAFCQGSNVPAVCIPSRAMLLTGRPLFHTSNVIPPEYSMWPEALRGAGYATFGTGKWHNNPAAFNRCFERGGAIFFGGMTNQFQVPVQDYDPAGRYEKARQRIGAKFSSELFADEAVRFLESYKGSPPFCLYVAFTAPHDPRTPPGEYATMYDPARLALPTSFLPVHPFNNGELKVRDEALAPWPRTPEVVRKHTADYYGMISHLDAQVGRILKALEATGRAGNTLVVYTSDHGLALGRHGLLGKQNLYDHSMRPPLLLAGPGVPKGGRSDALCYLFDLAPTVCELAGVPTPATVEGKSLVPVLAGRQAKVRDTIFLAYRDVQRAARTERWKLIRYPRINKSQFFELSSDPDELRDLAGDPAHKETLERMTALLAEEQRAAGDKLPLSTDKPAPLTIDLTGGGKPGR